MLDSEAVEHEARKVYATATKFFTPNRLTFEPNLLWFIGRVMDNQVLILKKLEKIESLCELTEFVVPAPPKR